MATTVENSVATDAKVLQSYLDGKWQAGTDDGAPLVNPCDGSVLARASSKGLDLKAALDYSRNVGGPELRKLSYAQRAELLGKIADALAAHRDEWYEIARKNSGNTKADAAIDVDGSIGTLKYFAKIGAKLGGAHILRDGSPMRLARDQNFQGLHVGVPLDGVAVHINAFNFPAWGLWEKAAVSLLAGVPVLSKPATSTAWLAQEMVHAVIEAGILPPGALSILCGSANLLPTYLQVGDAISFTGSAKTAREIQKGIREGVRVNVEADSLNAALLGPDAKPGSLEFDFFVREVVREMTSKTGQKCTAIRRVLVPSEVAPAVTEAIAVALSRVVVGDPANSTVTMGPVVNMAQRKSVEDGINSLSQATEVSHWPEKFAPVDASLEKGAFVPPIIFMLGNGRDPETVHQLEVFGPVATVVPYRDKADAFAVARRGGGSLAASVFSGDAGFLAEAAVALGTTHGRLLLVDPAIGDSHTGHGIVLPSLMHGGPGRAGGGEELGGSAWAVVLSPAGGVASIGDDAVGAGGTGGGPVSGIALQIPQQRGEVLVDGKRLETLWIEPADKDRPDDRHAARRPGLGRAVEGLSAKAGVAHRMRHTCLFALWTRKFRQADGKASGEIHAPRGRSGAAGVARQVGHREADFARPQRWRIDRLDLCGEISRPSAGVDSGSSACVCGRPQRRQHHRCEGGLPDDRPSAKTWALSSACGCDVLGLERHLARPKVSLVEHRGIFAGNTLPDFVHSGRRGRIRNHRPGKGD